jgi:hypothetical protein
MTYQDTVLLVLSIFFVIISPIMVGLAIYGIWVVVIVFTGELTQFNEKHLLPQEEEESLEDRLEYAFSQPLEIREDYNESDKKFAREYNERLKNESSSNGSRLI